MNNCSLFSHALWVWAIRKPEERTDVTESVSSLSKFLHVNIQLLPFLELLPAISFLQEHILKSSLQFPLLFEYFCIWELLTKAVSEALQPTDVKVSSSKANDLPLSFSVLPCLFNQ